MGTDAREVLPVSAAIVPRVGKIRQLDGRAEPDEVLTPEDAADTTKLAKLLIRILRELAQLRRRWWPRQIDFEDVPTNTVNPIRLPHGFGGRVRWWTVDADDAIDVALGRHSSTDKNTLVLTSTGTSVVTIRVQEAG